MQGLLPLLLVQASIQHHQTDSLQAQVTQVCQLADPVGSAHRHMAHVGLEQLLLLPQLDVLGEELGCSAGLHACSTLSHRCQAYTAMIEVALDSVGTLVSARSRTRASFMGAEGKGA